jgi:tetraacyldisaccharide 4'-kinase
LTDIGTFSVLKIYLTASSLIRVGRWWLRYPIVQAFAKLQWLLAPLLPLLWLYRLGVAARNLCYDHGICKSTKLTPLVLSIGNLSVGGTGKTPATILIAQALREAGWRVAIVARGYRRQRQGLVVVSDGQRLLADIATAGDEPLLLAHACGGIPVVVDRQKKIAALAAAEKFSPDIIIIDDGFQHRQLHRDIDVVMVDTATPLRRWGLFSVRLRREPASALRRAHFIIVNTSGQNDRGRHQHLAAQCQCYTGAAVFSGGLKPMGWRTLTAPAEQAMAAPRLLPPTIVKGQPVLLVSGIAHPERFRKAVERYGARIQQELIFTDHYHYRREDLRHIEAVFTDCKARYLLTTSKDAVKLAPLVAREFSPSGSISASSFLVLEVAFETAPGFLPALIAAVRKRLASR